MELASTVLAIVIIVAIVAGAVYFIYATRNKNKPSYMVEPRAPKMTKEEKVAAKQAKKAEKADKPEKKAKAKK